MHGALGEDARFPRLRTVLVLAVVLVVAYAAASWVFSDKLIAAQARPLAIAWLSRRTKLPDSRIGLIGWSNGAAVSIQAAASAAGPVLRSEWSIVQAALPAVIGLGLAWLGIIGRDAGVNVTPALGLPELFGRGLSTSRRAGRDLRHSLPIALVATALGAGIVLPKVAVH